MLTRIDGKSYKVYKGLSGKRFTFPDDDFDLTFEYIQGDPFASPSKLTLAIPPEGSGLPPWATSTPERRIALCDFLARRVADAISSRGSNRSGSGKSGLIAIEQPGQKIARTSAVVMLDDGTIEVRLVMGLPARGRRIAGHDAARLVCDDLPSIVLRSIPFASQDEAKLAQHLEVFEDSVWLRAQLAARDLVAFVIDGATLPRRAGDSDLPLESDEVVPFLSPDELRVTFDLPNAGAIEGMGVPGGVTAIVGGGYHGKSTLLQALSHGVYDHIPGDGREFVVTERNAVKIRAEDGRSITGVDISAFIGGGAGKLPGGRDTRAFSSADASGSTSQAASIIEAIEVGATTLLMDEDTCATNFMIRDARMQRLIASEDEPITPFIDRVRELYEEHGVSTILVIGGCGDYFEVTDHVIAMRAYRARDVSARARDIARSQEISERRSLEASPLTDFLPDNTARCIDPRSLDPRKGNRVVKTRAFDTHRASFGERELDLSGVEQIVHIAQTRAILDAMVWCKKRLERDDLLGEDITLADLLDELEACIAQDERGLLAIAHRDRGDLAMFRRFELAAALSRYRDLKLHPPRG